MPYLAKNGQAVLFFTVEMSAEQQEINEAHKINPRYV